MISSQVARTVKNVLPHGLVMKYVLSEAARRRRIAAHDSAHVSVAAKQIPYSYSAAINFLTSSGLSQRQVIGGSIPEPSLSFCSKVLDEFLLTTDGRPLIGLHVGNFLGVSLSHFVNYVRQRNDKSVVVSIDPDLTHRGIENPQKHVIAILKSFWTAGEHRHLRRILDQQKSKQRRHPVLGRQRSRIRSLCKISERTVVRGHPVKSLLDVAGKV